MKTLPQQARFTREVAARFRCAACRAHSKDPVHCTVCDGTILSRLRPAGRIEPTT